MLQQIMFKSMKKWNKNLTTLAILAFAMPLFAACGPSASTIPERDYTADTTDSPGIADADKSAWAGAKLVLDRANKKVTITLADNTKIESAYTEAPRDTWPDACPGNFSSSSLEILQLKADLTIGSITFKKPALLADCFYRGPSDPNPERVTLLEESAISSEDVFGSCSKDSQCVKFRTKINCDPKGPCT